MKQIHVWIRNVFIVGFMLSLVAGIQLFTFSEKTELIFAWTIQSPLTAATLGAFYFGTMTFGILSAREKVWANVQAPTIGLFVFLLITLMATALHLDKFHLDSPSLLTRSATWAWILIYTLLPIALVVSLLQQARLLETNEAEVSDSLPAWLRMILALHGITGVVLGVLLFITPQSMIVLWGWQLTPLTARAFSAWLVSYGIVDLMVTKNGFWHFAKVASVGYLVSSVLALVALARYSSEVQWFSPGTFIYLAFLLVMAGFGALGRMTQLSHK